MSFLENYMAFTKNKVKQVYDNNKVNIEQAAKLLLECEKDGGRIYTFGTGHSHMIGQDLYGRAGGYAKFYPILEIEMTLATHPTKSTHLERCASYADILQEIYHVKEKDVILVTSNSGRNALVIEYVMRLKAIGVKVIVITSLAHSKTITSRHESGLRLFELGDIVLDNGAPYGDAGIELSEGIQMGPISTLTGCFLAQCLAGRFVEMLIEYHMETPVFRSSNMDGADEHNKVLFEQYVLKTTSNERS